MVFETDKGSLCRSSVELFRLLNSFFLSLFLSSFFYVLRLIFFFFTEVRVRLTELVGQINPMCQRLHGNLRFTTSTIPEKKKEERERKKKKALLENDGYLKKSAFSLFL